MTTDWVRSSARKGPSAANLVYRPVATDQQSTARQDLVLVDSRLDRWEEVFNGLDADIRTVVCGHTHMPFVRLAHGRLVINPGSIGMPYGRTGAHWALLGPGVELRTTHFDLQAAATQLSQDSSCPDITEWADYFLNARATDADALTAFAPRDGRDHSP